ncbi:MAG TPA: ABC transporter permease subunit [Acidimicrobiales bacterium]|nr:ABC transporter permease subunit [Acidimicrobiales bacterium]
MGAAAVAGPLAGPPAERGRGAVAVRALLRIGRALGLICLTVAVICGIWQGLISAFHLSSFVAKGPVAVYDYAFTSPSAASVRSQLLQALAITLRDAGLGYLAGTVTAVVVAVCVVLRRELEQTLMPVAIGLRSVPLVALTPLLTLVFGQGLAAVTVIAGVVTFFPTLVNVAFGLRSAPAEASELMAAYGATSTTVLRTVRIPYALPALFASARIAAPGALLGAILAEWLATGQGLGDLMVTSSSTADYSMLWASVVLITTASIVVYNLVSAVERPVVARLGLTSR